MIATNTVHMLPAPTVATARTSNGSNLPAMALGTIVLVMALVGLWGAASLIGGMISAGGPLGLVDGFIHALAGIR